MTSLHELLITKALAEVPNDPNEKAWHFRRLFDRIAGDLTFTPVREAKLPEGFPGHGPIGAVVKKEYPAYRSATAEGGVAFMRLFRHIQRRGIPMTAPVEMSRNEAGAQTMGFLYEDTQQGTLGDQDDITVVDTAPMTVLSMALRGQVNGTVREQARNLITAYATEQGIAIGDEWRLLGYSSPRIPRERRYSEIQVTIINNPQQRSQEQPHPQ